MDLDLPSAVAQIEKSRLAVATPRDDPLAVAQDGLSMCPDGDGQTGDGTPFLIEEFIAGDTLAAFAILIQLGAILALLSIYFIRLWKLALGFFTDPAARRVRGPARPRRSRTCSARSRPRSP